MGFVIRETEKAYVRIDNPFQEIPTKRGKELLKQGLAIKKKAIVIIIYSEIDFNYFYRKHCARIPNDKN